MYQAGCSCSFCHDIHVHIYLYIMTTCTRLFTFSFPFQAGPITPPPSPHQLQQDREAREQREQRKLKEIENSHGKVRLLLMAIKVTCIIHIVILGYDLHVSLQCNIFIYPSSLVRQSSSHNRCSPHLGVPIASTVFLDALMGALSVRNDDSRCLFALSLIYAMLQNEGMGG